MGFKRHAYNTKRKGRNRIICTQNAGALHGKSDLRRASSDHSSGA